MAIESVIKARQNFLVDGFMNLPVCLQDRICQVKNIRLKITGFFCLQFLKYPWFFKLRSEEKILESAQGNVFTVHGSKDRWQKERAWQACNDEQHARQQGNCCAFRGS